MPPKTTHYELTTPVIEGTEVLVEGNVVTVRGPKGEIVRDFTHAEVDIQHSKGIIRVSVEYPRSRQIALVGTITSHIKNMMLGVVKGVIYKMKVVFAHFPPSIKVADDKLVIENFYGEKSPRIAQILPGASVEIKGDDIVIEGIDIEIVAQTAANFQRATRLRRKDPRKFHDGIYVYEKHIGDRVWQI